MSYICVYIHIVCGCFRKIHRTNFDILVFEKAVLGAFRNRFFFFGSKQFQLQFNYNLIDTVNE